MSSTEVGTSSADESAGSHCLRRGLEPCPRRPPRDRGEERRTVPALLALVEAGSSGSGRFTSGIPADGAADPVSSHDGY